MYIVYTINQQARAVSYGTFNGSDDQRILPNWCLFILFVRRCCVSSALTHCKVGTSIWPSQPAPKKHAEPTRTAQLRVCPSLEKPIIKCWRHAHFQQVPVVFFPRHIPHPIVLVDENIHVHRISFLARNNYFRTRPVIGWASFGP